MAAMSALFAALATIGSTVAANEAAPKPAGNLVTPQAQGGAKTPAASSVFGTGLPQTSTPAPPGVSLGQFIDPMVMKTAMTPGTNPGAFDANAGPAHPMPGEGTPQAPSAAPTKGATPGIGDTLSQIPQALATIAPLLGLGQQQQRRQSVVLPAQGGGHGGEMVQGFNLPHRTTIGELLASLPRPRYG